MFIARLREALTGTGVFFVKTAVATIFSIKRQLLFSQFEFSKMSDASPLIPAFRPPRGSSTTRTIPIASCCPWNTALGLFQHWSAFWDLLHFWSGPRLLGLPESRYLSSSYRLEHFLNRSNGCGAEQAFCIVVKNIFHIGPREPDTLGGAAEGIEFFIKEKGKVVRLRSLHLAHILIA